MTLERAAVRPEDCLARHAGDAEVPGLDASLRIVRDRWGIPHIQAGSARDAFFGQGYCIAQDRAFQLELYRRMAYGTSAALLNRGLLPRDRQNRRLGFGRLAAREWEAQSDAAREVLQAYADGINAALASNPVPYEFRLLGHEMLAWSPVDSLAVIKMVNSSAQWASKLRFAKVAAVLGAEAVAAQVPDVPLDSALITPSGARWQREAHPFFEDIESAMGEPDGPIPAGAGSNCWVIHGSRTDTGAPIVCGDPHLAVGIPAQWYVVHLECPEFTVAGPCNPCYPGPHFYGHNTRVAWTMTHAQGDRWDLYRERVRQSAGGPEVLTPDGWTRLARRDETFEIRDDEPVTITVWETPHGPVLRGDPARDGEVLAARWGLAVPTHDVDAMNALHRSTNVVEARAALRLYDSISGNFCFADTAGDIAYQYVGRIPKRPAWLLPVPGWDGEHEWRGDVPKEELPSDENPANGFIVTANNKTTTPDYPHYLSYAAAVFRADRLRELMDATDVFRLDEMPRLQGDVTSLHARAVARFLTSFEARDADARSLQAILEGWDGHMGVDSAAAAVYAETCQRLARNTVRRYYSAVPDIPALATPEARRVLFEQLTKKSPLMLGDYPSWEAAAEAALAQAAAKLRERQGPDPSAWRWGADHKMGWSHNLGRDPELRDLLDLPPTEVGGDGMTVFNTATAYGATAASGVSFRQIYDLADLNGARICIPPGNSGQPGSPHYADNVGRWRDVEYHPLYIEWSDIETHAEAELKLSPATA
ncbi:MAG: penicillin acylase family protein [Myxococcota bacterium]